MWSNMLCGLPHVFSLVCLQVACGLAAQGHQQGACCKHWNLQGMKLRRSEEWDVGDNCVKWVVEQHAVWATTRGCLWGVVCGWCWLPCT